MNVVLAVMQICPAASDLAGQTILAGSLSARPASFEANVCIIAYLHDDMGRGIYYPRAIGIQVTVVLKTDSRADSISASPKTPSVTFSPVMQ